jgi:SAM-dependent methyltransferase
MMYVFPNAAPQASSRLAALSEVFNPGTMRHLLARGLGEGWRCLEIGGGGGSVTRWLSDRVGPRGCVLTTDIDTRHLETLQLSNVEVCHHDIVSEPLPEATFDLAYARLVLEHLSDPDLALGRMADSLRPGGWLMVEDFEVLHGTDDDPGGEIERASKTVSAMRHVTATAGADARLGRSLARRLRALGLADVGAEGRVLLWQGRTAGASLMRLNCEQLREPILATGLVTAEEFDTDLAAFDDEDFEIASPVLWTAWGRRSRQ